MLWPLAMLRILYPGGPKVGKIASKPQRHVSSRVGARHDRGANPLARRLAQGNVSAGPKPKFAEHPEPRPSVP